VDKLDLIGISGVCNLLTSIKMAKYYELDENDVVFTILTDSMELYGSRLEEMREECGEYTPVNAAVDFHHCLLGQKSDHTMELTYRERKRVHNLKYFTWIEQQGMELDELNAQWYDRNYWDGHWSEAARLDKEIEEFNARTEVLNEYL